jgi:hypothetical protein
MGTKKEGGLYVHFVKNFPLLTVEFITGDYNRHDATVGKEE